MKYPDNSTQNQPTKINDHNERGWGSDCLQTLHHLERQYEQWPEVRTNNKGVTVYRLSLKTYPIKKKKKKQQKQSKQFPCPPPTPNGEALFSKRKKVKMILAWRETFLWKREEWRGKMKNFFKQGKWNVFFGENSTSSWL